MTLTDAGRAALVNAAQQRLDVQFSAIVLGSGTRELDASASALTSQQEQKAIFSGVQIEPGQLKLSALFDTDPAAPYPATELALIGDGVVFGVWSTLDVSQALVVRTPGVPYTCSITVGYGQLPSQDVSVIIQPLDQAAKVLIDDALVAHVNLADPHPQYVSGTIDQSGKPGAWRKQAVVNLGLPTDGLSSTGPLGGVNRPNLLFNGSAECGSAGWNAANSGGVDTSGLLFKPYNGTNGEGTFWSLDRDLDGSVDYFIDCSELMSIGPVATLSLQVEVFTGGLQEGNLSFDVEFLDATPELNLIGQSTRLNATPGRDWTYLSMSIPIPAGALQMRLRKIVDGKPKAGRGALACRRIKLEVGATPTLYSTEANLSRFAMKSDVPSGNFLDKDQGGTISGDVTLASGKRLLLADGSERSPSLTFTSDGALDTGLYHPADGHIAVVCNAVPNVTFAPDVNYFHVPTAGPTPAAGDSSVLFATTAWVTAAIGTASIGQITFESRTSARAGYLICDGSELQRADYPALWAYAQASGALVSETEYRANRWGCFSSGNDTTTFRIPELRGEFLRCHSAGRTDIEAGREIGSFQDTQNLSHRHGASCATSGAHKHTGWTDSQGWHDHPVNDEGHAHSLGIGSVQVSGLGEGGGYGSYNPGVNSIATNSAGSIIKVQAAGVHNHNVDTNPSGDHNHLITIEDNGGNEARPRNVALLAMICAY
ncbi:MAG: phage tail protein [Burkholderia gladioli]